MAQKEVSLTPAYRFSLDIIDFEYIKINHENRGGIKPLWDVTNNKQYYEFEVIAERNQETQSQTDEIFDESSIETCTCHICNVSVPKMYIKEHYASAKHKICLELTNKAMERARNFITNLNDISITKPPTNTYFCAPCSLAIHVNDKTKHEKSKAHVLCVKHDELLDNLLKIYNCNDIVKVDIENTPPIKDIVTDSDAVKDEIKVVDKTNKTDVNKVAHDTEKVELSHVKADTIEKVIEKFEIHYHFKKTENLNEVMCKVCKVMVTFTEEMIEMHMGGKNHKKNYNKIISRLKQINDKFYCETCHVIIKENCEIDHVDEHVSFENLKALQSQQVPKKLDEENVYTDYAHIEKSNGNLTCKVCNVAISNNPNSMKLHMDSLNHKARFDSIVVINKLTKRNDVYFCELCSVLLTKNAEIVHVNSETHKSKLNTNIQPLISPTINQNQVATNGNKIQSAEKNWCSKNYIHMLNSIMAMVALENKFTLSYVNDDFIEILGRHLQVKVHVNNFHGFYESDGRTHCRICALPLFGTKADHIEADKHMERVLSPIANLHCVREERFWKHCILCNEIIDNVYMHSFISHKHKIKLQEALVYSQLHRNVVNSEILTVHQTVFYPKIYCIVCSVEIDTHNYAYHVIGRSHISKYTTSFPELPKPVDPEREDIENEHYHVAKTSNAQLKHCKTCQMYIDIRVLDSHLKGFEHRCNYHSMLIDNRMKTVTNGYYCDACEQYISKFDVADHASTQKHEIQIKSPKPAPKFDPTISVTGNTVTCRVCEMILPYIPREIDVHLKDEDHIYTYNTLLVLNKFKKVDKRYACDCYVCEICDVLVMENEEIDHMYDPDHKKKIGGNTIHPHMKATADPKTMLCKVCKVKVPSITANVTQHVNSYRHVEIQKILTAMLKLVGDRFYCEHCKGYISNKQEIDHALITHINAEQHEKFLESFGIVKSVKPGNVQPSAEVKNVKPGNVQPSAEVKNVKPGNVQPSVEVKNVKPTVVHQHMEMRGTELICRVCNVPVPNNTNGITTHVNGYNHTANFNDLIKSNRIVKHDDRYFCEVCRIYNANGTEVPHLFSDKHRNAMSSQPSSSTSASDSGAANVHTCIVCNVKVPNHAKNIEEHNKGSVHNANLRRIATNIHDSCKVN